MSATLELAWQLIRQPSITPDNSNCQQIIADRLRACGFQVENFDKDGVQNLWARRGTRAPLLVFAGHTDVVPVGNESAWKFPPFDAVIDGEYLHGRGAADMKGGLAAIIVAVETFVSEHADFTGSIGFLITGDEEGPAINGTRHVMQVLQERDEAIDYCIVGEPSSRNTIGDVIRVGRRGSLNGTLTIHGKQGHVAYPELADNPIHHAMPALSELSSHHWDDGLDPFPPTSFQVSNIAAGTGAENVIPGELVCRFNFRFSPAFTPENLKTLTCKILDKHGLRYSIEWRESGLPFYTGDGLLRKCVNDAIARQTGNAPIHDTAGGTSDGRFIAPTGAQVVELGPCNATIHQIDECVSVSDLDKLMKIHTDILGKLLIDPDFSR